MPPPTGYGPGVARAGIHAWQLCRSLPTSRLRLMEPPVNTLEYIRFAGEERRVKRPSTPLVQVSSRPGKNDPADDCPRRAFMGRLLNHAGLQSADYRPHVLERRVAACLRHLRVASVSEAERLLARRPELLAGVLDSVLIGVSSFFRDAAVFEQLALRVLPTLKRRSYRVRVLSAGAAHGQELYSIAMLLAEAGMLGGAELLGIDARLSALRAAAAGWYPQSALEGVAESRRQRFFVQAGAGWQVVDDLRATAGWQAAQLPEFRSEAKWDIVLCRNVAIYFDACATQTLWRCLSDALAPGGFLVAGKAEQPPACLGLLRLAPCLFQKPSSTP